MQQVCIEGVRAPTQILGRSWFYPNLTPQKKPEVIRLFLLNQNQTPMKLLRFLLRLLEQL